MLGFVLLKQYFVAFPFDERVSGVKHLQIMTKLSPIMYWTTCFIWDFFCYIIIVIFTFMVISLVNIHYIYTIRNELGKFIGYKKI